MKLKQERSKEELAIPLYNKELAMKLQQSEREVLQLKLEKWGVQIESAVHVYIGAHICLCWLYLLREYVK